MPQEENTTTENQRKQQVQLDYVLLDVDFFEKPKIRALRYKFKNKAASWLTHLYMQMSRATNATVDHDLLMALAIEWEIEADSVQLLVEYCVMNGLIECVADGYSNRRVLDDQQACAERRQRMKEAKEKSASKKHSGNGKNISRNIPETFQNDSPDTDTDTEDLNTEVLDPKKNDFPQNLLPEFITPNIIDALRRWRKYQKERWKSDFSQMSCDALLMQYAHAPRDLAPHINKAISNGWKNITQISAPDSTPMRYPTKPPEVRRNIPDARKTEQILGAIVAEAAKSKPPIDQLTADKLANLKARKVN